LIVIRCSKRISKSITLKEVREGTECSVTLIKAKIANAEQTRVHTILIIGGRDMEACAASVCLHHSGPQGAKPEAEVVADILE